jgi:hypothetical protein
MTELEGIFRQLSQRHQAVLNWFHENAGFEVSWPKPIQTPEGITHLASKAKGIYKPEWSEYAVSVRQSLRGPYPD